MFLAILSPVNEPNEAIENINFESQADRQEINEQEESESEDEDRYSTQGFDPDDIFKIQNAQEEDPFADIINLKQEAVDESKLNII